MKLKVENIVYETEDAVSLHFKNKSFFNKVKYKPGQFLTLNFTINERIEKRAYSLSSSPLTDQSLRVTIKKVKEGLVSNYIYNEVKVGDKIEVENAKGSFFIEPNAANSNKYVLFAGGSGITPVLSILKSILKEEPDSGILLFFANRNHASIIFKKEIALLAEKHPEKLKVVHILEQEAEISAKQYAGNIRPDIIQKEVLENRFQLTDCSYFLCGPAGFMESVKEMLTQFKVPSAAIKTELFKTPTVKFKGEHLISKVTIQHKGSTNILNMPGNKTILQSCLSNNIQIPYSCKAGMCSTCKSMCVEGNVEMSEGHFLTEEEVNQGYVLNCISYPTSENVILKIA